jgi:ABC-2 type transport system permease protein
VTAPEDGVGGAPRATPEGHALCAFAELRARLFWRRVHGPAGVPELVARIVLFVVAVPGGLVLAALAGTGAFSAVRARHGVVAELAVAGLFFGIWQTWTAVALSLAEREGLDLRRFLVYPVAPSRLFAYGVVASVVGDPFAVFWCLVLAGSYAGAVVARPGAWVLLLALVELLFVAGTVVLVSLLQELLARLLRVRWAREAAIATIYVGTAGLVASFGGRPAAALELLRVLRVLRWAAFPAAFADRATVALYAGNTGAALPWVAALALSAALGAVIAFRLALASALSGGASAPRAPSTGSGGWPLPGRIGALVEKEGKYLVRHPLAALLALILPALAGLVMWKVAPRIPQEGGEIVRALPLFAFALYAHVASQVFFLNAFGWERGGGRAWFLAPVPGAEILVAKNLAAYGLSLVLFLSSAAVGIAAGGAPPRWALAAGVALHLGIAPWLLAAGNLVSVLNPRAAPMSVQRGGALSPLSSLAGMFTISGASALFAVPVVAALRLDAPWVLAAGWAGLGVCGAAVYAAALPGTARLLARRREVFIEAVADDEA